MVSEGAKPGVSTSALWFLTDAELFGWGKPKPRRPQRTRAVAPEVFFADVQPGDYVVHLEHGIGQFKGLIKMAVDGVEREYLQVEYAQSDQLYVPVHQADRLARYVGAGDATPSLHRLGTADWEQVKARARKAVAEIADELLELYAAREVVQGHAFSPDAAWQGELEASFPYVETEDQLIAIESVKHDMEQPRPMDRLICGDVGYGKTEVALRAAFKAVMDGKQVAILVPTTVLAQQHYTNFSRRLAAFPVSVAMLSRFQTPAQQDRTLSGLANGSTDLVIGTHRLLSNDVAFKDLGLLIVDEEQRFGVSHKEKIKQLRTEVDVLTLTATPIPRTLHMSLTGVRDLSTIDTPPEERLPIKTWVGDFDEGLVRQAVLRELDRNGQVYFVHNRVQGIEQIAARVSKIVPEARTAIAHGQMPEKELSAVMLAFAEGDYDILVCTTIIESGLDIPNANTIIINRADTFGLAQLYQLRGRVGRSAVRAYAYLLVDKYKTLTEDSRRRLEAIQEASDLGAGFRIAMRDLEIRGAGELLGARQHGHIAAVGFDLYTRLLAQAVQEARERAGGASKPPRDDDEAERAVRGRDSWSLAQRAGRPARANGAARPEPARPHPGGVRAGRPAPPAALSPVGRADHTRSRGRDGAGVRRSFRARAARGAEPALRRWREGASGEYGRRSDRHGRGATTDQVLLPRGAGPVEAAGPAQGARRAGPRHAARHLDRNARGGRSQQRGRANGHWYRRVAERPGEDAGGAPRDLRVSCGSMFVVLRTFRYNAIMISPDLPLIDLHRHLEGNVRPETVFDLLRQHGLPLPVNDPIAFRRYVQIDEPQPGLLAFFEKFDWVTGALVDYEACERIAYESLIDARTEGLDYLELRFSPLFMAKPHRLDPARVTKAVVAGIQQGRAEAGIGLGLIGIMSRTFGPEQAMTELQALLTQREHLVAIDLAGDEIHFPADLFVDHFRKVRDAGLHITVHAGEAAGPESIWQAIRLLGAERIGHGFAADQDDSLVAFLAENQIGLEMSLTSNVQISAFHSYAEHPVRRLLEAGVLISLSTDDPGISAVDIRHEYEVAAPATGLTAEQIRLLQTNALKMAFLSENEKAQLGRNRS